MLRVQPTSSGIYIVIMLVKYHSKVFITNCLFGQIKKYAQIGSSSQTKSQKEVNSILEIKHRNYLLLTIFKVINSLSFCTRLKASQTSNRNVMPFPNDLLLLCTTVEEVDNPEINSFPYYLSQKFVVKILKNVCRAGCKEFIFVRNAVASPSGKKGVERLYRSLSGLLSFPRPFKSLQHSSDDYIQFPPLKYKPFLLLYQQRHFHDHSFVRLFVIMDVMVFVMAKSIPSMP